MNVVHDVFEAASIRWRVPGIAYGVVRDGELAATGGIGRLVVGTDAAPDADSVFRIASMTKSFTAAAVMRLIDEGLLAWDVPVAEVAAELASWRGPTADAPALTLRHLLTMDGGLPTDDPWADRHLDASREEMDALFAAGASFAWPPGVAFEYSNLAWGLVGRIVEHATGKRIQDLVTERLLGPLGMTRTTWVREAIPAGASIAVGYDRRDGDLVDAGPPLGDGGIAPMGGLWTTVGDLARWVALFLDAFPPRDDPDDAPLPRAARREMQQLRRLDGTVAVRPRPDGPSRTVAAGYGLGLFVWHDPRLGRIVGHSGGLPGWGSHMRWLPERGFGVIALANSTYAPMSKACAWALDALADAGELPAPRRVHPSLELADAAARVATLLDGWSDEEADRLFADNVDQDDPRERRRAHARERRERIGPMTWDGELAAETPLRGSMSLADGRVRVELGLDAEAPPRLQWLDVTDRTRPSDEPLIADPTVLAELPRCVVVVARPVGELADRFEQVQGALLDRFPDISWRPPGAHATIAAFGSVTAPLDDASERTAREVTERWAASTPPLRLELDRLDAFDGGPRERIPIFRIRDTEGLRGALRNLRALGAEAGLPPGASAAIEPDRWVFHLSLGYPREIAAAAWAEVVAWTRATPVPVAACDVEVVDVLGFGLGPERALGRIGLSA